MLLVLKCRCDHVTKRNGGSGNENEQHEVAHVVRMSCDATTLTRFSSTNVSVVARQYTVRTAEFRDCLDLLFGRDFSSEKFWVVGCTT